MKVEGHASDELLLESEIKRERGVRAPDCSHPAFETLLREFERFEGAEHE